jgi:hypothetical protein
LSFAETPNNAKYVHIAEYNFSWTEQIGRICFLSFLMARQPLLVQTVLIIEASRSHTDTLYSVGLLWTSDQPDAEISACQHTTLTSDTYPCPWRNSNRQSQPASSHSPTPETARPLGSAFVPSRCVNKMRWLPTFGLRVSFSFLYQSDNTGSITFSCHIKCIRIAFILSYLTLRVLEIIADKNKRFSFLSVNHTE